jgi:hypothetical protein
MSFLLDLIRHRLASISVGAGMRVEALHGATLDLTEDTLGELLGELDTLDNQLVLVLDRLASAADPARAIPDPADIETAVGHRD